MRTEAAILLYFFAFAANVASQAQDTYPHVDENGYYLAYKDGDRWANWWREQRPRSFFSFVSSLATTDDQSAIPTDEDELDAALPVHTPYFAAINRTTDLPGSVSKVRATWIGHSTVLAEVGDTVVITDPMFSLRASPSQYVGPRRYRPPACDVSQLPEDLDAVVISHSHYDHLDRTSCLALNERFGSQLHWFVPAGLASWVRGNAGVDPENIHEMVWWQQETHPRTNATITFTPANHWTRRGLFDRNKVLWGSWAVVDDSGKSFWFAGDTAYADVFQQIGNRFGGFDLAAIPIGAFKPRLIMRNSHVDPAEAVAIHRDVRARRSLGVHWGTFKLSLEHFLEPRAALKEALNMSGLDYGTAFAAVDIGQTVIAP